MVVRVAVLGCGLIAERDHLPAFAKSDITRIIAVVSRDLRKAERFRVRYGASAALGDWREAITREDVDVVDICLPNFLHAPVAIAAAKAGKHVLVEKPMATSLEEADAMIAAARTHGVQLRVAQNLRSAPLYRRTKQTPDSGLIGRAIAIRGVFNHAGPDEFWGADSTWFWEVGEAGGGAMLDLGIHIADLIRWLKGTPVVAVSGMLNTWEKPTRAEDNGMALLRFADGTLGYFQASWVYRPTSEVSLVVQGEKGTLFAGIDPQQPLFARLRSSNDEGELLVPIDIPAEDSNRDQYDHFARSILSGDGEAFVSGEEASKSLEVILAAYQSAKTGREVSLESGSRLGR